MGETALIIFTFCLQAAIGTLIFTTLEKHFDRDKQFKKATLVGAILSVVGILASFVHLGHPQTAVYTLSNVGKSWLSNEVLLSSIFTGIAVLYAVAQRYKPDHRGLNTGLSWIGSLVGLITVFAMAKVYTTASVPAWSGANTFVDFYATAVAVGVMIFLATSHQELKENHLRIFPYIILATVAIQAAVAVPYAFTLSQKGMAAQESAVILSNMSAVIGLKWLLILGGAGLLLRPTVQKSEVKNVINTVYLAGVALLIGEIIGRYVFYAAMIVSNIGLT